MQADKNDKGELLEQITGTEIYGEISKKVFDRNRTEKDKLDIILLELQAIKILSDEELKILTDEIIAFEKEKNQVDKELQEIETAKKWLADIVNLKNQINESKQKIPELEEKIKTAKETFEKSESLLKTVKEEHKKQEPVFKKVRELDTKIIEKEKLLQPIKNTISDLEKRKNKLSIILENQNTKLEESNKLLLEKQNWATENKKYEKLVSNYSAIEKENQILIDSSNEIEKLKTEIADLQKSLDSKKSGVKKTTEDFNEIEQKLTVRTKTLLTKKTELEEILEGKELSQIQSKKENILNFIVQIKNLIDVENSISTNKKEIEDINVKLNQFEQANTELLKSLEDDKKKIENLENHIKILTENINLTKTIQSLDEHRSNLKDGEECPLCGSLEHPFAIGNIPQLGEKEKELAILKEQLQEISEIFLQHKNNQTKLVSNKNNDIKNKEKEEKHLLDNKEKQHNIESEIKVLNLNFSIPKEENKIELLNKILTRKSTELKVISNLIQQAETSEKQLKILRDKEIPELQKEKEQAEKAKNDAVTSQKLISQQFVDKQKLVEDKLNEYAINNTAFLKKLKSYNAENIEVLKKHLEIWNKNNRQKEELTIQITSLTNNISLNTKDLENQIKLHSDKQKEKQNIESDKQKLSYEREELFAKKTVEEEENRLNKMLEESEANKTKAEKAKNDIHTELEKNKAIVTEREKDLLKQQEQKITEKSIEELQIDIDEKKEKANNLSQEIGAKNQKLNTNDENLKASGNKLKAKEKQQTICNKWGKLNELIGSSDGKKYRNFAQALTFDHLIGLSNKQLQKMSERYILKRIGDNTNPFELSVIDKFQNSEERTVKNLSGGEKFIVSLSLALGLANMTSKNMHIDTMFIDEGFGTLDSDYLDVALNALSNLQSEGKIIGVISHLTELKERIATHIEVIPSGNGHSKIQITY